MRKLNKALKWKTLFQIKLPSTRHNNPQGECKEEHGHRHHQQFGYFVGFLPLSLARGRRGRRRRAGCRHGSGRRGGGDVVEDGGVRRVRGQV